MWRAFKSSLLLSEPPAFLSAALNLLSLMVHLADLNSSVVTTPSESTSIDSIDQRNTHTNIWVNGGSLNEAHIYNTRERVHF